MINLSSAPRPQVQSSNPGMGSTGFWKDMSMVYRIYQQCSGDNMSVCLKVKLLTGLEKAFRSVKVPLAHGALKSVGQFWWGSVDAKEQVLNNMILKRVGNFLQDHTLQVKFDNEANSVEGRKKKEKKGNGAMIMIPLLLGGTIVPLAYGALAMLAGKALIVSKLALVLASIIGIKKLLSGGGGGKESSHEVVVSSGGHSGWGRELDTAYSGWKPAAKESAGSAKSL
ncbi:GD19849 [Drosophila simulans]|uniref:GD19849 n=1 Tax=Drosophila simulans TaxID=7240 RepID=B4QY85_DROSI|nr:GD19849 [Drosophila simulans]